MRKTLYILLVLVLSATSCIYDYDPVIVDADSRIVIEGDIIIGGETQVMTSYMMALDKSEVQHPKGIAWVEDSKGNKYYDSSILPSSVNRGNFFTINTKNAPNDGREYRLCFRDEETKKEYASSWSKPISAPTITKMFYDYDDANVNVRVNIDGGKDVSYFRWDYKETWRYHAEYVADYEYDPKTNSVNLLFSPSYDTYYCWSWAKPAEFGLASARNNGSTMVKGQVVTTNERKSRKMSIMYKLDITARGMSKDSYTYHNNMLTISDLTGSLFTASPDDMRGNIVCTSDTTEFVIGYVEPVVLHSREYYLDPIKAGVYKAPRLTQLVNPLADDKYTIKDYWGWGYVPIVDIVLNGESCVGWGEKRCVDCALDGGTYEKPEDWDPYSVIYEWSTDGMR